ncbi:LacI family DNA-binding transcriptional regulator [Paraburkholderia susongensis]|uniref:Transcriptional regulator, LacI family n=1 Tax=Paraburkholderia susongensis TaxID=1515439 RepID=A0A1X7M1C6_9BURK|nr:LacI family DNA-binding transcriptional regulator [Paraburkholderia susongensis]SMG59554.1 transcriptional regulator, LacI family [Paraburkholderia susongensis]
MKTKRATAKDVAELVGCSVSAVSLVVSGRTEGRINNDLRDRIEAAVQELDYRPNQSARTLATRSPSNIAFVCPDIRNPFFGEVFHGLSASVAAQYRVQLRVPSSGLDFGIDVVRDAQSENIAGLILAAPSSGVMELFRSTCPTVLLEAPDQTLGLPCVDLNLESAAKGLAQHLLAMGHRRVGYLSYQPKKGTFVVRRHHLEVAMQEGGAHLLDAIASAGELTIEEGEARFFESWKHWKENGVTAVVAADDILAYGAIRAAKKAGLHIPGQLSVAGFNDIPFSALIAPPLTSVDFRAYELGQAAGAAMINTINGRATNLTVVETELHLRASTGAATPLKGPKRRASGTSSAPAV